MKYRLVWKITWTVGSCRDERSAEINEEFQAETDGIAIQKAKQIREEKHERYSHFSNYKLGAELRIAELIWKTELKGKQPARPARKESPAVEAHFEEKKYNKEG